MIVSAVSRSLHEIDQQRVNHRNFWHSSFGLSGWYASGLLWGRHKALGLSVQGLRKSIVICLKKLQTVSEKLTFRFMPVLAMVRLFQKV